jgi:hypothetical protein
MSWAMRTRIIEMITGMPHRHEIADSVSLAAAGVARSVDRLSEALKPYANSDKPLVALLTDVFNKSQMKSK